MERLIELSQIVTKNRLKKIDMLSHDGSNHGNKYLFAADSIAKGNIASSQELAKIIGVGEKSNTFHVFKLRLFDKLLNSMLFLDVDKRKFQSYRKAISDCNRNMYCVIILFLVNARQTAAFIASKTLHKALKFELSDVILYCARYLRAHYSFIGDSKNFKYYNGLVRHYHEVLAAEDEAAEYLETINVIGGNSNTSQKEFVCLAEACFSKVQTLFERFPTYQISLNYYRIRGITTFLKRDYAATLKTWEEFDTLIDKYNQFEPDARKAESELNKMDCYLHMRDFRNGSKCAVNCDNLFMPFSNNWYIFKEYYLLLTLHTKNYHQAAETINLVVGSSHFSQLTVNRQEKWRIFEAYLYILWKSCKVKGLDINKKTTQLRISTFLNNSPIFSKDKKGYNVSILIIQIVNFLIEKNYAAISDKIDALERYAYRYFTEEKDSRARTFLKMVIEVERSGFDLEKVKERTSQLFSKLKKMQIANISGPEGLEIVPFADLWEIITTSLS